MTAQVSDWPRALALLDEALALTVAEREPWLVRTAADMPLVMPLLRKLLAAHDRVEVHGLLATLPKLQSDTAHLAPYDDAGAPGQRVGPFELIEPLGHGGMGSVWRARYADGRLKRDVAVKLPATRGNPASLAILSERFARERDFLAQLEHPNIARLYDAGVSQSGQPFLAMEYVAGRVITDHCDAQKLVIKDRLALFLQVLDAVAHAHQQLVLHRDLKAGNVLVDEHKQVRLLDFGVARLLPQADSGDTASDLTERAGAAFTLGHAAPEQLTHGTLSTATDVYALGVMLYHLLTGLSPYQPTRDTRGALEDAVLQDLPEAASARAFAAEVLEARQTTPAGLRKALQGDLDLILGKALKKTPGERYPTAAALAQDLKHHLARKPISVRADGWAYRAGLFVTRHRTAVVATTVAALALLGSSGVALWQARVSAGNAAQASKEASRANAAQKFFVDLLAHADPEKNKNVTSLDRKLADEALANAERDFADAPDTLLVVLKQLGTIYHRMGLPTRQIEALEKRLALLLATPSSPVDEIVGAQLSLGEALNESPDAANRAKAGPTLTAAREMAIRQNASHSLVVQALCQSADQLLLESKHEEADRYAEQAVALAERTLPNPHPNLSWAYEQRGVTSSRLGQLDAARAWYRKAIAVDATGHGRRKMSQVNTRTHLAITEYLAGNYRASKREALSAIEFAHAQFGDTGHTQTPLRVLAVLATVQSGEPAEAERLASQLLAGDLASDNVRRVGQARYAIGVIAMARGEFTRATLSFENAKAGMATDPRWRRRLAAQTAVLEIKRGRLTEAHDMLEPLIAEIRSDVGLGSEEFAALAEPAAVALRRQGHAEAAQRLFEEACVSRRKFLAPRHPNRVRCESYLILGSGLLSRDQRIQALQQQLTLLTTGRDDHIPLAASLRLATSWASAADARPGQGLKFPLLD